MQKKNLKLKALRAEHELTQLDMSKIVGLSIDAYRYKENGDYDFTKSEIDLILDYFNVKYEDIFYHKVN